MRGWTAIFAHSNPGFDLVTCCDLTHEEWPPGQHWAQFCFYFITWCWPPPPAPQWKMVCGTGRANVPFVHSWADGAKQSPEVKSKDVQSQSTHHQQLIHTNCHPSRTIIPQSTVTRHYAVIYASSPSSRSPLHSNLKVYKMNGVVISCCCRRVWRVRSWTAAGPTFGSAICRSGQLFGTCSAAWSFETAAVGWWWCQLHLHVHELVVACA